MKHLLGIVLLALVFPTFGLFASLVSGTDGFWQRVREGFLFGLALDLLAVTLLFLLGGAFALLRP